MCRRLHTNTKCIAICGKNVTASCGVSSETQSSAQPSPTRPLPKLCCLNNIFTNTPVSLRRTGARARARTGCRPVSAQHAHAQAACTHASVRNEKNLNKYDIRAARGTTFAHRCASPRLASTGVCGAGYLAKQENFQRSGRARARQRRQRQDLHRRLTNTMNTVQFPPSKNRGPRVAACASVQITGIILMHCTRATDCTHIHASICYARHHYPTTHW